MKFQDNRAGGLEVFRNTKQYYVRECMSGGATQRDTYTDPDGKNGKWTFTRKSGDESELTAFLEGEQKFSQNRKS